ncbi:MAG TPA: GNAT family N-acetyltransferase [Beijerinckiaceae bacterium]|jgi:RimJ/RimL family protein N-acetyltransferase/GNAT superfamily N-acetyltransferase
MTDLSHWTPRPRPERRVHEGRYLRLEPLAARHGDALFAAGSGEGGEALWRYLPQRLVDRAAFDAWFDGAVASEDPLFFAAVDRHTGRAEGRLSLMRIDPGNGVIETGHLLFGPRLSRTRGATEAIYLLARHVFDDLGYRRFEWKCNDRNEPSKRAALRFGFTFEGVFRQHMVVKGENRDTAWYSILDGEWPARRRAFERWLDPSNFDEAGCQRLSLASLNAADFETGDPSLRLRFAGPADLAALGELQRAAYVPNRAILGVEPLPLLFDYATLLGHYEAWVVEGEGGLAGALILDPRPDHLLVWSLATAPAAQGQGLGKRLLAAAEARARSLGLDTLRLYTGEKLTGNVRWYHRHGYAIERVEELDDRRLVHMVKAIA